MTSNTIKSDAIGRIVTEAHAQAAEYEKGPNYINTRISEDRSKVTITTVIDHKPLAWIEYDADQLDVLLKALAEARDTISGRKW